MQKHEREALVAVEAMREGMRAELTQRGAGRKGHKLLIATLADTTVRVQVSCSPADETFCTNNILQAVRRRFRERGVAV